MASGRTVSIERIDPEGLDTRLAELQTVFEAIYGLPNGAATGMQSMLREHARRDGFKLCIASVSSGGSIAGFAYGFTGEPGQPWRDDMAQAVGDAVARQWLKGHFEFAEFGVLPDVRRRGIGTALYRAVFHDLPHQRAVLTVRQNNTAARAFYDRHGWKVLHDHFVAEGGYGPYLIMGLVLRRSEP